MVSFVLPVVFSLADAQGNPLEGVRIVVVDSSGASLEELGVFNDGDSFVLAGRQLGEELSLKAVGKADPAKDLACQNFNVVARILDMQSDP